MRRLRFVKMEGAGNDYIYVNAWRQAFAIEDAAHLVPKLADRHFGVGSDGLILLASSQVADVRMIMWNADGSRGGMCGNGIRCLAKLAHDDGVVQGTTVAVETDAGIRSVELCVRGQEVVGARVEMGAVHVETTPRRALIAGREWLFYPGDAGNTHAVIFATEDIDDLPVEAVGRALQHTPPFADGVNVDFVTPMPDYSLRQRTYERGSGETLACGSGATVAATAAVRTGRVPGPIVAVHLRGGSLTIHVGKDRIVMEGPAREAFRGEIDLDRLAGS